MSLPCPAFLVNPVSLRYVDDDRHVIAYFSGHPEFECAEAMFSARDDGSFSARAILTRHDQSQMDFINDAALLAGEDAPERTRVLRDIAITLGEQDRLPLAEVRFQGLQDEPIVLRVACASRPDPARGGLTDPGAHALGSSLPLMWRRASALAGAASSVEIAGVRYVVPEMLRKGPHFVAHHGFFTEGFHMAAIRNETRTLRVLRQPQALQAGERWVYATDAGELAYDIQSRDEHGLLRITSSARQRETVHARETPNGLALEKIVLESLRGQGPRATIAFDASNAFTIGLDGHADTVSGTASQPDASSVLLQPQAPGWAAARPVHVECSKDGDLVTLRTTCSQPASRSSRHI